MLLALRAEFCPQRFALRAQPDALPAELQGNDVSMNNRYASRILPYGNIIFKYYHQILRFAQDDECVLLFPLPGAEERNIIPV